MHIFFCLKMRKFEIGLEMICGMDAIGKFVLKKTEK